jgi:hypothetical protein
LCVIFLAEERRHLSLSEKLGTGSEKAQNHEKKFRKKFNSV